MKTPRNPTLARHLKRLNTRQRKKQRLGEFVELGFSLQVRLRSSLDHQAQDHFLDGWLNVVDQHRVSFGGQFDPSGMLEGVVFPVGTDLVTQEIRAALMRWLEAQQEIESLSCSERIDLWHQS